MPLARIVTSTPAQVAGLAEYLRSRGYTVELVEPGTIRNSPAELEMDLEGCTAAEAMSQGIHAAEAAQSGRRAIAYDITGRPVAFADEEEPPAKGSNAVAQAWNGLGSAWREMLENLRLPAGRLGEWFAEGRRTIHERHTRYQEERSQAQAEKERQREAQWLTQEAERSRRQEEEEAERRAEAERSRRLREEAVLRAAAERSRRQQEEAARREAAERMRREQQEAARRAELAAAQERMRDQQEQRREELAERERRIVARFRHEARLDTVRERFQVEQSQARRQVEPAEAVLAERAIRRPSPRPYRRENDGRKAAVAAIVLALLATLGYAACENRQPAAPLSNRALVRSQNVSQPVPFGAATVPPPQLNTTATPSAALPQSELAPTAPAEPAPSPQVRRARHTRSADDAIADDEVIVHRSGSPPPSRTTASSTPKHFSDLEQ